VEWIKVKALSSSPSTKKKKKKKKKPQQNKTTKKTTWAPYTGPGVLEAAYGSWAQQVPRLCAE
jgi:hypothetical protein